MKRRPVLSPAEQEAQAVFAEAKASREARAARVKAQRKDPPKPGTYVNREMRDGRGS